MKNIYRFLLGFFFIGPLNSQTFLNGSFETTAATCSYNISNATFNGSMSNCTAFGVASQIDIMQASCGYGGAQDGNKFIALAIAIDNTSNDAFSLSLNTPLIAGTTYTVSFYQQKHSSYTSNAIEIGYSNTANSFGTSIQTFTGTSSLTWVQETATFTPVINAGFLTVRTVAGSYGWNFVDNFTITSSPLPVQLTSFYGECNGSSVDLFWTTASEQNNARFSIETSSDGIYYREIAEVTGAGNSNHLQTYHQNVQAREDERYFRLVQIDYNGDNEIFHPVYMECEVFSQSPCPVILLGDQRIEIDHIKEAGLLNYNLTDYTGQTLTSGSIMVQNGKILIDVNAISLAPGIYIINIQGTNYSCSQKIFKP